MKKLIMHKRWALVVIVIACWCTSCSITKQVPKGDALYTGASIKVRDSTISSAEDKNVKNMTTGLARPKPNSKFLGIRLKLILYNMGGNPDKGGFIRNFFHKIGQPPVLLSSFNLDFNTKVLQSILRNKGYFGAEVSGDTTVKKRKAHATFTLEPGPVYTIDTVAFDTDSTSLGSAIQKTFPRSFLKTGAPFDLQVIEDERSRIDAVLKQRGYYYFNPDFLIIEADTTVGTHQVNMHLKVKRTTPEKAGTPYIIDNVYIYPDYHINKKSKNTTAPDSDLYKGYYIIDSTKKFREKLFPPVMRFDSGDIYNRRDHNLTLSRLINLDVFKYVKNKFQDSPNSHQDTGRLNAYYYLTPKPKKSINIELSGNTKSNNFVGSLITVSFRNRNTFRAAEQLDVHVNAGTELQYGGNNRGYNSYKLGGGVRFTIPKFVVPFFHFGTQGAYLPKTIFSLDYDLLDRRKLYTLNSLKGEWGFHWKPNLKVEQELNPVSINYVKATRISQKYLDSILTDPLLKHAIDTQFVLGSNYSYTINHLIQNPHGSGIYFNAIGDISGNVAGLVVKADDQGKKKLFGSAFAQYLKTQLDFRYYAALSQKTQWVNRALFGFGVPYGNSKQLPFIKQFFIGGNNSLRAFRSRSVGPGTFRDPKADSLGFFPDQSGDIKLELNSELRFSINSILEPAIFLDAGNIWLFHKDPNQPGGEFSRNFIKQLAVGTGVGLRIDLSILLLRFDLGIPLRKPWLPEGEQWVLDKINFGSKSWRRENIILNLAIGYPF